MSPDSIPPTEHKAQVADIVRELKKELADSTAKPKAVTKPSGWGRQVVSPYYREKFALEVKGVIDSMSEDGEDRIYYYEKFSKQPLKFSPDTLYTYVYQALRFLKNEDIHGIDKEYYAKLLDRIVTKREKGVGVRLSFHTDIPAAYVDIAPDVVEKKSSVQRLRDQVEEWMGHAALDDRLEVTRLALSPLEIDELKEMLAGTESWLAASITTKYIKLQKIA